MTENASIPPAWRHWAGLLGSFSAAILVAVGLAQNPSVSQEAAFMAGIFVLAALLWVTEALPLFATSLLVIGLQIVFLANPGQWSGLGFQSGTSPGYRDIIAAAADPVLLLFFGGFLLAQAAVKESVDKSMSALLLKPFGQRPAFVLIGVLSVTALFSMFMSNTATTAMMITLVSPMLAQLPQGERFRKALVLAVPCAANIGGMGTPIGSPPNAVATGFLQKMGHEVSFLQWMIVCVPIMIVLLVVAWLLLWFFFKPAATGLAVKLEQHQVSKRGWFVVAIFVITVLLWLTDKVHGLPAAVVALVPAIAFTSTKLLDRSDVNSLEWNVLILIAGGISLGAGMQMTGLDKLIVQALPLSQESSGMVVVIVLVFATIIMSTFMSNTAAANLLLPIGISAAVTLGDGFGAVRITLDIALAASLAMALPISTPPNAIAYAKGEFTTKDLVKVGVLIGLVGAVIVLGFSSALMRLAGVH